MSTIRHASAAPAAASPSVEATAGDPPRVRHQARDALGVMTFSAATSAALAAVLVLLAHLGR